MKRRRLLQAFGLLSLGAAGFTGWRVFPQQRLINPCRDRLPPALAEHPLVEAAWEGIDPEQVWDCHVHLVGVGDGDSGIWLNPVMDRLSHPLQLAQKLVFLNAGCAHEDEGRVDESYVERMRNLVDGLPRGVRLVLLAFDHCYGEDGTPDPARTSFYTPDAYARHLAERHPDSFLWMASIHPYREDALEALDRAAGGGALGVKWLPAAMGMDPASPRCDAFYEGLRRHDLPLLVHCGRERAVHGARIQEFGNPLRLRGALDQGVRVIVAHCASLGRDRDLDQGEDGPWMSSFDLFARLMEERRYEGLLFGDISAMTQANRLPGLEQILIRPHWHSRLLNGSDYPLPGVLPLYSVDALTHRRLITPQVGELARRIQEYNPLLFDFLIKRHAERFGLRLAPDIFETRRFLSRQSVPRP